MLRKFLTGAGMMGASLLTATAAYADGPIKAPTVEQMANMVNKGDTSWMLVSSALVLMMSVPALALFYGGLVRTKNMLSVLMQVFMIVSIAALIWVGWGYSLAFTSGTVLDYFETNGYGYNPRLSPLFYGQIAGAPRHYLKGLINYGFEFGLTIGARLQYFSGTPQWKQFQSPEDASYTLYRSPRGSSTGSRINDPTTWADFRLPDTFNLDLQIAYSLEKLTGQRIDIIAMLFNLLNLSPATAIETRDGATFGVVTRRPDNLFCEFVVRYRY